MRLRAPERRQQLLDVAARLFAERGYRGTTVADLAAAAGVTQPILYRHFPGKLDLFVELVEVIGAEVIATWRAQLDSIDDPVERLRALLRGISATHTRGRRGHRAILQAMSEPPDEKAIVRVVRRHLVRLHVFLEKEVRDLQRADVVRTDETAAALAWLLVDVGIGFGLAAPLTGSQALSGHGKGRVQRVMETLLTG